MVKAKKFYYLCPKNVYCINVHGELSPHKNKKF